MKNEHLQNWEYLISDHPTLLHAESGQTYSSRVILRRGLRMRSGGWVGETSESRGTNGEDGGGALSATAAPQHTTRGGACGATADVRPGTRSTTCGEVRMLSHPCTGL